MKLLFSTIKNILLWPYGRSMWQYDVLCVLILAFVFLTPKGWFEYSELGSSQPHPSRFAPTHVLIEPPSVSGEMDKSEVERRVRVMTGRPEAEVKDVRARQDASGKIVAYEVDIR
nr:putative binding domain protein [uncultured bacterium]